MLIPCPRGPGASGDGSVTDHRPDVKPCKNKNNVWAPLGVYNTTHTAPSLASNKHTILPNVGGWDMLGMWGCAGRYQEQQCLMAACTPSGGPNLRQQPPGWGACMAPHFGPTHLGAHVFWGAYMLHSLNSLPDALLHSTLTLFSFWLYDPLFKPSTPYSCSKGTLQPPQGSCRAETSSDIR
jgi:hypothetical protein